MRYVEVGGAKVSVIGLGAWQFGAQGWDYGDDYIDRQSRLIVDAALDSGVNLIDTAEAYGRGKSEEVLAGPVGDRRSEVFLATKVFPSEPLDADEVVRRAEASAGRMKVDRIDLYQQHWPSDQAPVASVMAGMRRLQDQGLVTHVGVSNFSTELWKEAESALGGPILSNQVRFSLVSRHPEQRLIPRAEADGRIVIAYSPLGQGFLSGRYDGTNTPSDLRQNNPLFRQEVAEKAKGLTAALDEVAKAHGATSAQVALAWVVARPNVVAIPGASSVEQMKANAEAADIELSADQDARLSEAADAFTAAAGEDLVRR